MEKRELTCIGCPMGCPPTVELENGAVTAVYGNTCPRGDAYARKEVTAPTRIVTTTVRGDRRRAGRCELQDADGHPQGQDLCRGAGAQGCDRGRPGDHRAGRAAQRRRHRRGCDRHKKCGSKVSGEAPLSGGFFHSGAHSRCVMKITFPKRLNISRILGKNQRCV